MSWLGTAPMGASWLGYLLRWFETHWWTRWKGASESRQECRAMIYACWNRCASRRINWWLVNLLGISGMSSRTQVSSSEKSIVICFFPYGFIANVDNGIWLNSAPSANILPTVVRSCAQFSRLPHLGERQRVIGWEIIDLFKIILTGGTSALHLPYRGSASGR